MTSGTEKTQPHSETRSFGSLAQEVAEAAAGATGVVAMRYNVFVDTAAQFMADLYGSLALTGRGHGTDRAVLLGLSGETPERINPDQVGPKVQQIREQLTLFLGGQQAISFHEDQHLRFRIDKTLSFHSNGMRFTAFDADGAVVARNIYYSVGGGFVVEESETGQLGNGGPRLRVPYPFTSAAELLRHGEQAHKRIPEMMRINELALRSHLPDHPELTADGGEEER